MSLMDLQHAWKEQPATMRTFRLLPKARAWLKAEWKQKIR